MLNRRTLSMLCLLGVLVVTPRLLSAQESDEDLAADGLARGWIATIEQGPQSVQRIDRTMGHDWTGHVVDPRVTDGPVEIGWSGLLESEIRGPYQFAILCEGNVSFSINGESVFDGEPDSEGLIQSDWLELAFDLHEVDLRLNTTAESGRLVVFWQGPGFGWERLPDHRLFHDLEMTPTGYWMETRDLVVSSRCDACHELGNENQLLGAPSLATAADHLRREWVEAWLSDHGPVNSEEDEPADASGHRTMPYFTMSEQEAGDLTSFILSGQRTAKGSLRDRLMQQRNASDTESAEFSGRQLLHTRGCLACHQHEGYGNTSDYGGGDLSPIGMKRSRLTVAQWLSDPASVNASHRMPKIELDESEIFLLSEYLVPESDGVDTIESFSSDEEQIERGRRLFEEFRCNACHEGPQGMARESATISFGNWLSDSAGSSCLHRTDADSRQPNYSFEEEVVGRLRQYIETPPISEELTPTDQLARLNCLNCHQRGTRDGVSRLAEALASDDPVLSGHASAMSPPSLSGAGDKLVESAFERAVREGGNPRRPWLHVRMPHYDLSDEQIQSLFDQFVAVDRLPMSLDSTPKQLHHDLVTVSGPRLIGSNGFGCSSCHQVGSVKPPNAPLNALGPDLSHLDEQVRYEWFRRWVANPSRMQAGMEMPSIQLAVNGVLANSLDDQLLAVWQILNREGFEPPLPEPIRIVRHTGLDALATSHCLTDVVRSPLGIRVKPFVIGLNNRHNILFNCETAQMEQWWIGDSLRQHTEGKTWFWELGGITLRDSAPTESAMQLVTSNGRMDLKKRGQSVTEIDSWMQQGETIAFEYKLLFGRERQDDREIEIRESIVPMRSSNNLRTGWRRRIEVRGMHAGESLVVRDFGLNGEIDDLDSRRLYANDPLGIEMRIAQPIHAEFTEEGGLIIPFDPDDGQSVAVVSYATNVMVDSLPAIDVEADRLEVAPLNVVPGFDAIQLPINVDWMPTGMAWRGSDELYVTSLKGRIWRVRDSDRDGWEDEAMPFGDEYAAPFGVYAEEEFVDVIHKSGLLRLFDVNQDGQVESTRLLASGWGHTDDYHDWAVGLPRDQEGNYYIALSCQQDDRVIPATRHRGTVLKLIPEVENGTVASYAIEELTAGHRFPIGIALRKDGELFVTDNQGNYNPFNELNHVMAGSRYGFINAFERELRIDTPLTPPAINIPHPWTRSVNGICFLQTPDHTDDGGSSTESSFGPFEGHLVGCEYDTQRLIRMTLETVDGVIQGCAYPFSYDSPMTGDPLLGPIACGVSPAGELYIGCIRDSGWGGSNNIGNLVRMRLNADQLPSGIREVTSTKDGFTISFVQPVDVELARDTRSYRITRYRRESTPIYGGPDLDRSEVSIEQIDISDDGRSVRLDLAELETGFVYQFDLGNLAGDGKEFFPSQAFYTLHRLHP